MTTTEDTAPVPAERRRPRASSGGLGLRLDAPERAGYVRRFVNADPSRIKRLEDLGYTLVNDKAATGEKRTAGLGTRIARHAGKLENGAPQQAILMETPVTEFNYGLADREEARKPFEDAIRRSQAVTPEGVDGAYAPTTGSSLRHSG